MRKELTAHVHKYMGFLTETVYEMKGTTKLYIPQDDLSDTDSCVKNSDLKMRLESTVIHCQIKKVLNAGDDSQEKEEEGPLSEVEHWRSRSEDLSGIKVQHRTHFVQCSYDLLRALVFSRCTLNHACSFSVSSHHGHLSLLLI